jgi:nitrite reductase/ring-hydroxylating ferredoxin subunit
VLFRSLFEIEDGFCIAGPCAGDQLRPVTVEVNAAGNVVLREAVSDMP